MNPTGLLQVQQRLVRSPEVVELEPQQEHVWQLASQLEPSPAELESLLVLADLHWPYGKRPRVYRLGPLVQLAGLSQQLAPDRDPFLQPTLQDPVVREIVETLHLNGLGARFPGGHEPHGRRHRRKEPPRRRTFGKLLAQLSAFLGVACRLLEPSPKQLQCGQRP